MIDNKVQFRQFMRRVSMKALLFFRNYIKGCRERYIELRNTISEMLEKNTTIPLSEGLPPIIFTMTRVTDMAQYIKSTY